ncbi:MAG: hypothetical protein HUK40_11950 [Desulfobacter sp.]|nr:hypothetical protein [Desulfobacter sp.]WDP84022.1 MAG: hypothetical protein HUN05_01640 [Desulfobacter sp.]
MKLNRLFLIFLVFICCVSITPLALAEMEGQSPMGESSGSGASNDFMKELMGLLSEGIDEFIGNYKGRLGDIKLLDRRGNKIVLEVTYDNVKRSDNVHVQGEVRQFGEKLEGFQNTLSAVTGRHGKARLTIGWNSAGEDDGWGTTSSQVQSDQIRLFLIRGTNPDRPFGEIIYDLPKVWTNSSDPDQETMTAGNDSAQESDGIELEEGQAVADSGGAASAPSPGFVKPGMVLKPHIPQAAGTAAVASAQPAPPTAARTVTQVTPGATMAMPVKTVKTYDLYKNARFAKWKSKAGALPYPGKTNDKRGFVRQIPKAALSTGNTAISLLQTHPQWTPGGWIQGVYPAIILGPNLHFKSVVGFLKGASRSDGATFLVSVKTGTKTHRLASKRVRVNTYASIDADLSRWAGQKVQISILVHTGKTSTQDWAVWVKPRLTQ